MRNQTVVALPPHVLQRPDMQAAIARHDFGEVFALARKWAGISFSKIAEACAIKPERVGALARGQGSIATYEKIAAVADGLRIPGHMLGLASRSWEAPSAQEWMVGPNGDEGVNRRDFLRVSAFGVGAAFTLPAQLHEVGRGRIGSDVPEILARRAARLRRLDDVLGGGDTANIYLAECEATKSILRKGSYSAATEKKLLAILAEQTQQAGWAAFDAGEHAGAERLYRESHAVAQQVSDPALAGNALAFLAYQKIGNDPVAAVQVAEASCAAIGGEVPATVKALLHERRAWAHAVAGNAEETGQALSTAEAALLSDRQAPQRDWSSWVDERELKIMAGRCWTELRRPLRAVPLLEDALRGFDDTHARDKALYSCWLADAYLMAGEVEAAAGVAEQVLELSAGVASVRPRQRLQPILRHLASHGSVPAVAAVLDKAKS
ncbi:XRE family transcriptional regulator [Micromonospora sp. NPDC004551]|uniref:XRE family transcriptional regulator n=1 Tax=Micromonospora sp. NPDC004551 TaxID=3154284 RepID=UPI00339E3FA2